MELTRSQEDAIISQVRKSLEAEFVMIPKDRWWVVLTTFSARVVAAAVVLAGVSYFSGMLAAGNVLRDQGITAKVQDINLAYEKVKSGTPLDRLTRLEEQQAPPGVMLPWNSQETDAAKLPPGWRFCDASGSAGGSVVDLSAKIVGGGARGGSTTDPDGKVVRYVWIGKVR